jgi:hypothetical protein
MEPSKHNNQTAIHRNKGAMGKESKRTFKHRFRRWHSEQEEKKKTPPNQTY